MAKSKLTEMASPSLDAHNGDKKVGFDKYEIEGAASDLLRAEKHKKNKKLMKHVHKHLNDQKAQIESIQDIKDARNMMAMETRENGADEDDAPPAPKKKA